MNVVVTRQRWTQSVAWLALCGAGSALIYLLVFFLPHQLTQYVSVPLIPFYGMANANAAVYAFGWVVLFALYYTGYRLCPRRPSRAVMALLVGFPLLFTLILLFMYPIGANDIFDQLFRGHVYAHLGVNPFGMVPLSFPGDPLLQYVYWKGLPAAYGPVWELLAGLTSHLAGLDLLANVLAYKLLVIMHFLAGLPLVYYTLRRIQPEFTTRGLFLYAWNPLMLFEIAGNGHSDGLLVFWVLLAVFFLVREQYPLAVFALTIGVLAKFSPLLLIPIFLAAMWQRNAAKPLRIRFSQMLFTLSGMGLLVILAYLPFGAGSLFTNIGYLVSRDNFWHSSVDWMAYQSLQTAFGLPTPQAQGLVRNAALLFIALLVVGQTWRIFRSPVDPAVIRERVLRGSFEVFFWVLLLATLYFQPWYLIWLLAFVPFLPRFGYAERATVFFFTSLGNYFIWFLRWPIGSPQADVAETLIFWVVFPLPFVFTLALWIHGHRGRLSARSKARSEDSPIASQPQLES
jgi:hypothetical protein